MKRFAYGLLACSLFAFPMVFAGCAGSDEDVVMEYDEDASKEQGDAYRKEMEEAMKNSGQMPQ